MVAKLFYFYCIKVKINMCLHVCVYHWFWKCLLIVYCVFNYLYISLPHISYVKSLIAEAFTMQFDILRNNFVNCTCKHAVTPHKDSLVKGLLLYLPIHITYNLNEKQAQLLQICLGRWNLTSYGGYWYFVEWNKNRTWFVLGIRQIDKISEHTCMFADWNFVK